jgi:PhnB protein
MPAKPKNTPEGFHSATPYICVRGAAEAIDWYKRGFGAVELMRHLAEDGRIQHAQIMIGDSPFMLSDEYPEFNMVKSLQAAGGSPVSIFLYVEDVDAFFRQAEAAGARVILPISDQQYGRSGGLVDPFGLTWWPTTPL